jgi:hypothetical protein
MDEMLGERFRSLGQQRRVVVVGSERGDGRRRIALSFSANFAVIAHFQWLYLAQQLDFGNDQLLIASTPPQNSVLLRIKS